VRQLRRHLFAAQGHQMRQFSHGGQAFVLGRQAPRRFRETATDVVESGQSVRRAAA
jgi:hypothetical protein